MPKKSRTSNGTSENSIPTRERVLQAAAKILSEKGYAGTRLADVAEMAGLEAPAIYYYFSSREALIAEVMSVGQVRLREYVKEALNSLPVESTPMDRICAAIRFHLQVELQLSDFATAMTRNSGQMPQDIRSRLQDESAAYVALWRDLLEEAREQGEIRPDLDLRAARMLIMGALNWTPEWWSPSKGSLDNVILTAQTLVRNGLGTGTAATKPASWQSRLVDPIA